MSSWAIQSISHLLCSGQDVEALWHFRYMNMAMFYVELSIYLLPPSQVNLKWF